MSATMCSAEFKTLSYTAKTEAVLKGTFLGDRVIEHCYVKLYNIDRFYVEVFFDMQSKLIIHFRAFDLTIFVMPYLDDLKIAV
jgi:hypothetical protein